MTLWIDYLRESKSNFTAKVSTFIALQISVRLEIFYERFQGGVSGYGRHIPMDERKGKCHCSLQLWASPWLRED